MIRGPAEAMPLMVASTPPPAPCRRWQDQVSMGDPAVSKGREGGWRCCFHLRPHCPPPLCCSGPVSRACGLSSSLTTTVQSWFLSRVGTLLMALLLLACSLQGSWDELNKGVGGHFLGWGWLIT